MVMDSMLIVFGWCWFVMGIVSGVLLGLGFHHEQWWGGYDAWRRRLARLGHISFFGTGGLALAMGLSGVVLELPREGLWGPGMWVVVGAVTMPLCCFLSAWRKGLRHGFALPVVTLGGGVIWFTGRVILQQLTF